MTLPCGQLPDGLTSTLCVTGLGAQGGRHVICCGSSFTLEQVQACIERNGARAAAAAHSTLDHADILSRFRDAILIVEIPLDDMSRASVARRLDINTGSLFHVLKVAGTSLAVEVQKVHPSFTLEHVQACIDRNGARAAVAARSMLDHADILSCLRDTIVEIPLDDVSLLSIARRLDVNTGSLSNVLQGAGTSLAVEVQKVRPGFTLEQVQACIDRNAVNGASRAQVLATPTECDFAFSIALFLIAGCLLHELICRVLRV
jgi:hypothetical protein